MITIYWWQLVGYTIGIFVGIYFIVERRFKQNNLVVSDFIMLQNERIKNILNKMIDDVFDSFDEVESRLIELEGDNGRVGKENN